ncbi:putative membrane protein [Streptococcus uberis 0140J]|uniref:Membrane protein n=1 Tax=Streptococcus uberis (strain ATCC BAA-854 / 0140J) TaxID=218495 RepID=B9DST2_STRU0|nr:putative membrane protein [Streptococcus uberis 0140J]
MEEIREAESDIFAIVTVIVFCYADLVNIKYNRKETSNIMDSQPPKSLFYLCLFFTLLFWILNYFHLKEWQIFASLTFISSLTLLFYSKNTK